MKNIVCKNCGELVDNEFCSNCGQSASVAKIDLHAIIHDFLHGILHVDKGIVYTMKELTLRPGNTIRGYFDGKRVKLFKPFAYLFIFISVYLFLSHLIGLSLGNMEVEVVGESSDEAVRQMIEKQKAMVKILEDHFAFISFSFVPFVSLLTMIFFRAARYNYGEHIVMNSYIYGHQMLMYILFMPLNYLWKQEFVITYATLFSAILFIYMIASVFNTYKIWKRILYAFIIQVIYCLSILIFTVIYFIAEFAEI